MDELKNNIERLRKELHFLILNKELIDIQVFICSQGLDKLLVQYEKKMHLKNLSKDS